MTVGTKILGKRKTRRASSQAAAKLAEPEWEQPDLKKQTFEAVVPLHDQRFAVFSLKKHAATLLAIFLSFISPQFVTDMLLSYEPHHWTVHQLPNSNTMHVTVGMVFEVLALQIYLQGKQNSPIR